MEDIDLVGKGDVVCADSRSRGLQMSKPLATPSATKGMADDGSLIADVHDMWCSYVGVNPFVTNN